MHERTPAWIRVRQLANLVNLSTPAGLVLAVASRATIRPGPYGTFVAHNYRLPVPAPRAGAVTVGDVVLMRLDADQLAARPRLLEHEARHSTQWACFLGVLGFVPAYLLGSVWSWWRCGDFAVHNPFERQAGLADGGYRDPRAATRPSDLSDPSDPSDLPARSARST